MAGYSSSTLEKKLGLKTGSIIRLVNVPENYRELFTEYPSGLVYADDPLVKKFFIHAFVTQYALLAALLPSLKNELMENGMIWISWPKKSSGVATDMSEDLIRQVALKTGLVDVKVCAVDDTWSALKLVIPLKDRKGENTAFRAIS